MVSLTVPFDMRLRVLTWNIHRAIGMDRQFLPERIHEVIRHHDPDLVLLQEVDRGVPRSRRLWLDHVVAQACDYPFHAWAQAHVLKEGSYGNAILSRWPIRRRRHLDLTIDRKKKRNALYARIRVPGKRAPLHVFNWHLGLAAGERKQQVTRLLHTGTMAKLSRHAFLLLGGDTNDWRNLLFLPQIKPAGFHAWSEGGRRRPVATFPAPSPVGALDKIFWRGPFTYPWFHASKINLAKVASDHRPLIAEFTW